MLPFWLIATISTLGLTLGSITDFDRREVPDLLNFTLIALGIGIGAINSLSTNTWWPLLNVLAGLGVAYVIAAFLFYSGQWGGGDAKMLMGLGALHGILFFGPQSIILNWSWPLLGSIILAIFVAGSAYSMLYFIGIIIVRYKRVKKALQKVNKNKQTAIIKAIAAVFLAGGLLGLLLLPGTLGWMLLLIGILLGGGVLLITLAKVVQEQVMSKAEHTQNLVPGDWLVEPVTKHGKIIVAQSKIGLQEKDIAELKKHHIKTVIVKEGIPFIPGFLLGYITILIWGNWIPSIMQFLPF